MASFVVLGSVPFRADWSFGHGAPASAAFRADWGCGHRAPVSVPSAVDLDSEWQSGLVSLSFRTDWDSES